MMASSSFRRFLEWLAGDPEARRLVDEAFERCEDKDCRDCVSGKFDYWYKKWLFGIRNPDARLRAARDIHKCLEYDCEEYCKEEYCRDEPDNTICLNACLEDIKC